MQKLERFWRMMGCVRRLKEQSEKTLSPFCARHGLTQTQLRALITLHFEGELTVSGLAESSCCAKANMSALCKNLAADGLILRRRSEQDERQVTLRLSGQGERLVQEFLQGFDDDLCKTPLVGAEPELDNALNSLEKVLELMEKQEEIPI